MGHSARRAERATAADGPSAATGDGRGPREVRLDVREVFKRSDAVRPTRTVTARLPDATTCARECVVFLRVGTGGDSVAGLTLAGGTVGVLRLDGTDAIAGGADGASARGALLARLRQWAGTAERR